MKIFRMIGDSFCINEANPTGNNDPVNAEPVFVILDYDAYHSIDYRESFFKKNLSEIKFESSKMYSPYEAIGAAIIQENPNVNGLSQIVDIEGPNCYSFLLNIINGKYSLVRERLPYKKVDISGSVKKLFNCEVHDMEKFEHFLSNTYSNEKEYGQFVWNAVIEHAKGNDDFDHLIAAFDNPDYAFITIKALAEFRKYLFEVLNLDLGKPIYFAGLLSSVLSKAYSPANNTAKLTGAEYIYTKGADFYASATASLALTVYNFPNEINIPLVNKGACYPDYSKERYIPVIDTGTISFKRENEIITLNTGKSAPEPVSLKLALDGNQSLNVSVNEKQYLI